MTINKTGPEHVSASDLKDLPQEVIDQLSINESDLFNLRIVNLINSIGGKATIDKILILLFKDTGKVHPRRAVAAKVYRMTNTKLLFSVPGIKGMYSTLPIDSEATINAPGYD